MKYNSQTRIPKQYICSQSSSLIFLIHPKWIKLFVTHLFCLKQGQWVQSFHSTKSGAGTISSEELFQLNLLGVTYMKCMCYIIISLLCFVLSFLLWAQCAWCNLFLDNTEVILFPVSKSHIGFQFLFSPYMSFEVISL